MLRLCLLAHYCLYDVYTNLQTLYMSQPQLKAIVISSGNQQLVIDSAEFAFISVAIDQPAAEMYCML